MSVADQRATQPEMFQKYKIVEIMPVAHNGGVAYSPGLEKPVVAMLNTEHLPAKIDIDTAENKHSEVS